MSLSPGGRGRPCGHRNIRNRRSGKLNSRFGFLRHPQRSTVRSQRRHNRSTPAPNTRPRLSGRRSWRRCRFLRGKRGRGSTARRTAGLQRTIGGRRRPASVGRMSTGKLMRHATNMQVRCRHPQAHTWLVRACRGSPLRLRSCIARMPHRPNSPPLPHRYG